MKRLRRSPGSLPRVAFTDPAGGTAPELSDVSALGDEVDAVLVASRALVAMAARTLAPIEEQLTASQWRALVVVAGRQGTALHGHEFPPDSVRRG